MNKKGINKWLKFLVLLIEVLLAYFIFNKFVLTYLRTIIPNNYADTLENMFIFILVMILKMLSFFITFSAVFSKY